MLRIAKTIGLIMALILASCFLVSCGPGENGATADFLSDDDAKSLDDYLKLAWSPMDLDEEYYANVTKGFEDYCTLNEYAALVANPGGSEEEQYSEFENWVAMGVDAIAASPVDVQRLEDMVPVAKENEIIVSGFHSQIPKADFNLTLDEYDLGYLMGQNALRWIEQKLGGKGKVFLILNDTDEALKKRGNGIEEALSQSDGARILATESVDSVPDAKSAAVSVFEIYRYINVVICINDDYALGVLEVVNDLDIEDENYYIGGAGYIEEAVQEMNESGSPFRSTVNLFPYENGMRLAKMMSEAVVNGVEQDTVFFEPKSYWQNILDWN